MKVLYEFNLDCGRMGHLDGRFLATPSDLLKAYGKDVYFGEVLGKHSEIYCVLDAQHVSIVTDNTEFLSMAEKLGVSLESGFNPLQYLSEDME